MEPLVGAVLEGKVTGITKFGAFVELGRGQSGLVHISEISNSYVNDVGEHLSVGQTVRVKVLGISGGKINLSIKKAELDPEPPKPRTKPKRTQPQSGEVSGASEDDVFEDKLRKFMQESDRRIAGNPMYADRGKKQRRR